MRTSEPEEGLEKSPIYSRFKLHIVRIKAAHHYSFWFGKEEELAYRHLVAFLIHACLLKRFITSVPGGCPLYINPRL